MRIQKFLAAAFLGASIASGAMAEPTRPSDDGLVLAKVAATGAPQSMELRAMQAELAKDPNDVDLAVALARTAIGLGRNAADPRYYGQAEAALAPWWATADAPTEVRVLRATINQAFHRFADATTDLDAVLAADPASAQARFSRAFIRLVTGEINDAAADCAVLTMPGADVVRAICEARVAALTGKGAEAASRLLQAMVTGRKANAAIKRFGLTVIADIWTGLDQPETAERYYLQVLAFGDADAAVVAAYADVLLTQGRAAGALQLLEDKGEADILLLRRAIAAKQTGDVRLAGWSGILAERFAAAAASGNRVHLREEARFQLEVIGDAKAALPLAAANWESQKEPADGELLLKAALATGNAAAAKPVAGHVARTGLTDRRVTNLLRKVAQMDSAS